MGAETEFSFVYPVHIWNRWSEMPCKILTSPIQKVLSHHCNIFVIHYYLSIRSIYLILEV